MNAMIRKSIVLGLLLIPMFGFSQWNNPHVGKKEQNTRHAAFSSPPKTLDPARAYSSDEIQFIAQIYEPPLQYHYLKRPYTLEPLTAASLPSVSYFNANHKQLPMHTNPKNISYSVYDITIKPHIYYQPHPAFAKNSQGKFLYHHLSPAQLKAINNISDFKKTGTREPTAADYIYEIKRLATPKTNSPIFGFMRKHILGFSQYEKNLAQYLKNNPHDGFLDLRKYPLSGVKLISRYHYQIKIKGVYPQFKYWLAMPFFAPVPWEADAFYSQPGMAEDTNLSLNWYPVGSGPYMLIENNPNKQMVLIKNPNFHPEFYPSEGEINDQQQGYLQDAGRRLPLIDKFVFSLDKESIPRWNKFLQGYYDKSGVSADSFDQAIKIDKNGEAVLTPFMKKRNIRLVKTISPSIYYMGFNMLNPVVGGYGQQQQKLRRAIAIALNYEEYISIFLNGRGIIAHGPIPPGIFGHLSNQAGINPYIYDWINEKPQRKSLSLAKKLLAQAGYPNGINPRTKRPLILNYDIAGTGSPDDKARFNWLRKQFSQLGIELNIRSTQYNRFQEKMRTGNAQIFSWGWLADYPDPENFLFLLYGPNAKVKYGGENAANYSNPRVDNLFEQIKSMPSGPKRQAKINQLLKIVQADSPWIFGFHPVDFTLSHSWNRAIKPHAMANNTLKYERVNAKLRSKRQAQWNQPTTWPIWGLLILLIVLFIPLIISYYRRQRRPNINKYRPRD